MKKFSIFKRLIYSLTTLGILCFSLQTNAQNDFVPNEIIIKFADDAAYTFDANDAGCSFVQNINCINAQVWCIPDMMTFGTDQVTGEEAIAAYFDSFEGVVEYAHPNWLVETNAIPNDPSYGQLWGMAKIDAPTAWDTQTGSESVIVGVIDSGMDWAHPDLRDNVWENLGEDLDGDGTVLEWNGSTWVFDPGDVNGIDDDGNGYADDFVGWDFKNDDNDPDDTCGHGTHVAGTIGATGNNNTGVSGVAWNTKLMGLKFLEYNPIYNRCIGSSSNAILALEYAVMNGAPITNNSWGGGSYNEAFEEALQVTAQNNHLFVAAAGNSTLNNDNYPHYPSSYNNPNVLTVASTTTSDNLSWFSNYGATSVDLAAPGSNIYSTEPDNDYGSKSGTSMAAPHVAGAAALLLSYCNTLTYQEIRAILMSSTDAVGALNGKCVSGGRLNVGTAMQNVVNVCNPTSCLVADSLALVALYNATDGPNWTNTWDLSQPVSSWYGVILNGDGCSVNSLYLNNNELNGNIPNAIGDFTNLQYLALHYNQLSGPIPNSIGNLTSLTKLRLENNPLGSTIPNTIGNLTNLTDLRINNSQLNGNIPNELGNLSNLVRLHLNSNQLIGSIPNTIGSFTNLTHFYLSYNQLSGPIPQEIGNLTNLFTLLISNNQLSGVIPNEIGDLTNLNTLTLYNNQLSGSIPNEIGNLMNLEILTIQNNQLSGCYPQSLCNLNLTDYDFTNNTELPDGGSDQGFQDFCNGNTPCSNTSCLASDSLALVALYNATDGPNWTNTWDLSQPVSSWYGVGDNGCDVTYLHLENNGLNGYIPTELCGLEYLTYLRLSNNQLIGSIPSEIGSLTYLIKLELFNNQLTGNIPNGIGNLINLNRLNLENNQLDGTIPNELGNLTNLTFLNLQINQLTGNIPIELGNLINLTYLTFWDNQLNGTIPIELSNLIKLTNLSLHKNQLTGNIPIELGNLIELEQLSLGENQLTGIIPNELGNLIKLEYLSLGENQLTGIIPIVLGNLINLEHLKLGFNQLTGSIPIELGNLVNLQLLSLYRNQLTGSIPTGLSNLLNLHSLWLQHNNLTGIIPNYLGNLTNLTSLILRDNNLEGCYPQSLCNLNLSNSNSFYNNPNLPDGGSDQGFLDFCAGNAPCGGSQYCNANDLDLGPDVTLNCGQYTTLSTGLTNMAYTLWDYEGMPVGTTADITVGSPGMYVAVVADSCGNVGIDSIQVLQGGSCVWPGDADSNNEVNYLDVLSWGLNFGDTGPARSNATTNWIGQACNDWADTDVNGVNDKHSDCTGNGVVSYADLDVITLNYGEVHGSMIPSNANPISNTFSTAANNDISSFNAGVFAVDVYLDQTANLHGVGFSLDHDLTGSLDEITFIADESWFGINGVNMTCFSHYDEYEKRIDVAITRTDGQNVSGSGKIGHLLLKENAVVPWDSLVNLSIVINNPTLIDNNGDLYTTGISSNELSLSSLSDCPNQISLDTYDFINGEYQAADHIESSSYINNPSMVTYKAGNFIELKPGTTITTGAELNIEIDECP